MGEKQKSYKKQNEKIVMDVALMLHKVSPRIRGDPVFGTAVPFDRLTTMQKNDIIEVAKEMIKFFKNKFSMEVKK